MLLNKLFITGRPTPMLKLSQASTSLLLPTAASPSLTSLQVMAFAKNPQMRGGAKTQMMLAENMNKFQEN